MLLTLCSIFWYFSIKSSSVNAFPKRGKELVELVELKAQGVRNGLEGLLDNIIE